LIVRETINEVMERVLVYRAQLLANVARRLHPFGEVQHMVGLASLDVSGQPAQSAKPRCESDSEPDSEIDR
jgi:hypothetical protein